MAGWKRPGLSHAYRFGRGRKVAVSVAESVPAFTSEKVLSTDQVTDSFLRKKCRIPDTGLSYAGRQSFLLWGHPGQSDNSTKGTVSAS